MKKVLLAVLFLFVFLSGCAFLGNSTGVAHDLQELRKAAVPNSLLVPPKAAARETYQNDLLAFRKRIAESGGTQGGTLNAYVDGSVSLIAMQNDTDEAVQLLKNVSPDSFECSPGSPSAKAILLFQSAREKSLRAHDSFVNVQNNTEIANALGADYVLNANKTSQAIAESHAERINALKIACGTA